MCRHELTFSRPSTTELSNRHQHYLAQAIIMVNFSSGCLGFGRMGPNRELKFALEKYWKGDIDASALMTTAHQVEDLAWDLQRDAGIDRITVGDFCLYDNVLQWSEWLGIIPSRFGNMPPGMSRMFAMARGVDGAAALSKCICTCCHVGSMQPSTHIHRSSHV